MLPVERSGHRGVASMAVEVANSFAFRDRRAQQRNLWLVSIVLLQSSERGGLGLDEYATKLVRRNELAKIVVSNAVERANLQKGHSRVYQQLVRNHIPQTTTHQ